MVYALLLVFVFSVTLILGNYARTQMAGRGEFSYWTCRVCGGKTVIGNTACAHCGEAQGEMAILMTLPKKSEYALN